MSFGVIEQSICIFRHTGESRIQDLLDFPPLARISSVAEMTAELLTRLSKRHWLQLEVQ